MFGLRPPADVVPVLSARRKWIAFTIAAASDLAQVALFPLFVEGAASPWEIGLDIVTAALLLFVVGLQWRFAFALAIELVPAVDLFPTWTALVLSLPTAPRLLPTGDDGSEGSSRFG